MILYYCNHTLIYLHVGIPFPPTPTSGTLPPTKGKLYILCFLIQILPQINSGFDTAIIGFYFNFFA